MRALIAASIAASLLADRAGAQHSGPISEEEFLAGIDASHPAMEMLVESLALAEAAAIAARTLRNPELGASRESPSGSTRQLDLTVSWQPPRPGRHQLLIAQADASIDAARSRLAVDRSGALHRARAAFAQWAVADAITDRLSLLAAEVDRLAQRERARVEAGETSGLDARRVELTGVEIRGDLARNEAELRAASELARAWRPDLPANARPQLPPLPAPPASPPAPTEPLHPRVAALRSELEAARSNERLAGRVAELPEILAGWQRQEEAGSTFEGPILGFAWPLPIFDRHRAERAAARARVESLEAGLVVSERETRAERAAAGAAYEELRRAAAVTGEVATGAPAVVVAATAAFEAGETDLTDLLDTLRSATAVEVRAMELHAEALAAYRDLELASLSTPRQGDSR